MQPLATADTERPLSLNDEETARYLALVDRSDANGCWPWRGRVSPQGYGRFYTRAGTSLYAHRLAIEVSTGAPIGAELFACHRCDNRICVRPDHLFLGTQTDNMRDMWSKGRGVPGRAFGSLAGSAKLSDEQALALRSEYRGKGDGRRLAAKYGVSESVVSRVILGRTYRAQSAEPLSLCQCSCGVTLTRAGWSALTSRRPWEEMDLEIAECPACGSTISVALEEAAHGRS